MNPMQSPNTGVGRKLNNHGRTSGLNISTGYRVQGRYLDEKKASFQSPPKGSGLPYYEKEVARSIAKEMAKLHPDLEWSICR